MAKVHEIKLEVNIHSAAERVITIYLTREQYKDALMTWLRLQGIDLPSQDITDYNICHSSSPYDKQGTRTITLIYKQKL